MFMIANDYDEMAATPGVNGCTMPEVPMRCVQAYVKYLILMETKHMLPTEVIPFVIIGNRAEFRVTKIRLNPDELERVVSIIKKTFKVAVVRFITDVVKGVGDELAQGYIWSMSDTAPMSWTVVDEMGTSDILRLYHNLEHLRNWEPATALLVHKQNIEIQFMVTRAQWKIHHDVFDY